MKSIAIISGVAGMTGSLVAAKLLEQGHRVVGFDNFFAGSREIVADLLADPNFTFLEYDLTDSSHMDALFGLIESECPAQSSEISFINCAAVVHTKHFYFPDSTFDTNVAGMRDSLKRAVKSGFSTYINCSTSEVYSMKSWEEGGVREESPVLIATAEQSLRTSYAAGKLMTEFFMREAVDRGLIKGCSIRFANVYSPSEAHDEHIIPHIIGALARDGKVELLENARDTYRTFLHNSDSCAAVLRLLGTPGALDGSVYNVGTPEEVAIVDLVVRIGALMGLSEVPIDFSGRRSADPSRRLLNCRKIHDVCGWLPEVSLEQGLLQCIEFNRQKGRLS